MILIGKKMMNFFFCVNYEITTRLFKNKEYPFFSTILSLVAFQFFSILFVTDFILFQILGKREILLERDTGYGILIICILIFCNYYYYSNNMRYLKMLKIYEELPFKKKLFYRVISFFVILLLVILTLYSVFCIKNNVRWFY